MITRDGAKMSKSKGNMISPAPYVERYGADTARSYILFIGPPDQDADWTDEGVEGVHRFLARLWRLGADVAEQTGAAARRWARWSRREGDDLELMRKAHWAIDKVTNDMAGRFAFNTAIAAVMELVNEAYRRRDAVSPATLHFATATAASLIFPFAPHTGAEVYELLTGERVWETPWPDADLRCSSATSSRSSCRSTASCATASRRRRRHARGARAAGARAPERSGAHRRQAGRQGHRRAVQARQLRRALSAATRSRAVPAQNRATRRVPSRRTIAA